MYSSAAGATGGAQYFLVEPHLVNSDAESVILAKENSNIFESLNVVDLFVSYYYNVQLILTYHLTGNDLVEN